MVELASATCLCWTTHDDDYTTFINLIRRQTSARASNKRANVAEAEEQSNKSLRNDSRLTDWRYTWVAERVRLTRREPELSARLPLAVVQQSHCRHVRVRSRDRPASPSAMCPARPGPLHKEPSPENHQPERLSIQPVIKANNTVRKLARQTS